MSADAKPPALRTPEQFADMAAPKEPVTLDSLEGYLVVRRLILARDAEIRAYLAPLIDDVRNSIHPTGPARYASLALLAALDKIGGVP